MKIFIIIFLRSISLNACVHTHYMYIWISVFTIGVVRIDNVWCKQTKCIEIRRNSKFRNVEYVEYNETQLSTDGVMDEHVHKI